MKLWPWNKTEKRASQFDLIPAYMQAKRQNLRLDATALSATVGACAGAWSRAFGMMRAEPEPDTLPPDMLASVGLSLMLTGESLWHIRLTNGQLDLVPVTAWDEIGGGKYTLHISHPNTTDTNGLLV